MLHCLLSLAAILFHIPVASAIPWNATEYMFLFGDSYTTYIYMTPVILRPRNVPWVSV